MSFLSRCVWFLSMGSSRNVLKLLDIEIILKMRIAATGGRGYYCPPEEQLSPRGKAKSEKSASLFNV